MLLAAHCIVYITMQAGMTLLDHWHASGKSLQAATPA
jgi:hypothetical protein